MFYVLKALQEKPEAQRSCGEFPKIIIIIIIIIVIIMMIPEFK